MGNNYYLVYQITDMETGCEGLCHYQSYGYEEANTPQEAVNQWAKRMGYEDDLRKVNEDTWEAYYTVKVLELPRTVAGNPPILELLDSTGEIKHGLAQKPNHYFESLKEEEDNEKNI